MGSAINILDSQQIKSFGRDLCTLASECSFVDASVVETFVHAEDELSHIAYRLRQQLQQAKDDLGGAENAEDRKPIQAKISELEQRTNQAEQLLHEAKSARGAYEGQVKDLQVQFSERAQKVGTILVSFIDDLEATS